MLSFDLAYKRTVAEYKNGVKFFFVAVDALSRKLNIQPVRIKGAKQIAKKIDRRITNSKPLRVSSDEGNEIKGALKKLLRQQSDWHLHHKQWSETGIRKTQYLISQKH